VRAVLDASNDTEKIKIKKVEGSTEELC